MIVLSGPPGAGKSTVAARLAESYPRSVLVTGDDFFGYVVDLVEPWLPQADQQNRRVLTAAARAAGAFAQDYVTVYEGVVHPRFVDGFLVESGAPHLHYLVLLPPLAECLRRVNDRRSDAIDVSAARGMWNSFDEAELHPRHVLRESLGVDDVVA